MKNNAAVPYAIIAILGILTVIVISFIGLNQREDIQQAEEGGGEQTEESQEGETTGNPEEIFSSNCASCHGADLSGGVGPDLTQVGSDLSKEDIQNIIINGQGSMPPGLATDAEAEVLASWLSEKQ
ncbi:cytochrome C [Virgibacillus profundi]|uniref:Cytochrome C n=1 Tax=Virgibacillus profundi TaxID=2024555 RepID=A0A2A2ID96_9BACI|nr:cytochrome c [Virgibacillus profundi]PAV29043.1 cytochrome C [Virgibacillus profundi]PXY53212.1 cytochrome c [Virgibacillus profundi]